MKVIPSQQGQRHWFCVVIIPKNPVRLLWVWACSLHLTARTVIYAKMFSLSSRRDNAVRYLQLPLKRHGRSNWIHQTADEGLIWLSCSSRLLGLRRFFTGQVADLISYYGTGGMSTWRGTLSENVSRLIGITNTGALEVPLSLDWDLN